MARVNETEVKEIMRSSSILEETLTPFINTANLMVETHLVPKGLSEDILKEIEKYLSAHFACARYPYLIEQDWDGVKGKTSNATGRGFLSTPFGATALSLDYSRTLSSLDGIQGPGCSLEVY